MEGKGKDRVELLCIRERGVFGDVVLSRTAGASEQERRESSETQKPKESREA